MDSNISVSDDVDIHNNSSNSVSDDDDDVWDYSD